MNAPLEQFVRDALAHGIPRERIRNELTTAGWRPDEIDAALVEWAESELPVPVPRRRAHTSAREAFLYLVMFAALYVVAFNAGAMLFAMIEWHWPDATATYGDSRVTTAVRVRPAVAALITAFPIFLFVARLIGRAVRRDPEKRRSGIRRWLTYLTLFLAAQALIGNTIVLVATLLAGEVKTRFMLKVAVVFAIAGIVFGHYLGDLRREEADAPPPGLLGVLGRVGGVATLALIVLGLWYAGSPHEQRLNLLDARRVGDLQQLARAIDVYQTETRRLPATLDDVLNFRFSQVGSASDPATGARYEYRTLDSLRYELCATFDRADTTTVTKTMMEAPRFWNHPAGRACFTITVVRYGGPQILH